MVATPLVAKVTDALSESVPAIYAVVMTKEGDKYKPVVTASDGNILKTETEDSYYIITSVNKSSNVKNLAEIPLIIQNIGGYNREDLLEMKVNDINKYNGLLITAKQREIDKIDKLRNNTINNYYKNVIKYHKIDSFSEGHNNAKSLIDLINSKEGVVEEKGDIEKLFIPTTKENKPKNTLVGKLYAIIKKDRRTVKVTQPILGDLEGKVDLIISLLDMYFDGTNNIKDDNGNDDLIYSDNPKKPGILNLLIYFKKADMYYLKTNQIYFENGNLYYGNDSINNTSFVVNKDNYQQEKEDLKKFLNTKFLQLSPSLLDSGDRLFYEPINIENNTLITKEHSNYKSYLLKLNLKAIEPSFNEIARVNKYFIYNENPVSVLTPTSTVAPAAPVVTPAPPAPVSTDAKRQEVRAAIKKAGQGEGGQFFVTLVDGTREAAVRISLVGNELGIGNKGVTVDLSTIVKVENPDGTVLYDSKPSSVTTDTKADMPIGKVGNTDYEVKADGVYYKGNKLDNPENKSHRQLIEANIERRRQEDLDNSVIFLINDGSYGGSKDFSLREYLDISEKENGKQFATVNWKYINVNGTGVFINRDGGQIYIVPNNTYNKNKPRIVKLFFNKGTKRIDISNPNINTPNLKQQASSDGVNYDSLLKEVESVIIPADAELDALEGKPSASVISEPVVTPIDPIIIVDTITTTIDTTIQDDDIDLDTFIEKERINFDNLEKNYPNLLQNDTYLKVKKKINKNNFNLDRQKEMLKKSFCL